MYDYIKGKVVYKNEHFFTIENQGMGYRVMSSYITLSKLELMQEYTVYTKLIVREDDMYICGFDSRDELDLFEKLNSVSKIGPKVALSILSFDSSNNIKQYIIDQDIKTLSKIQGIGKKTAERLVLELKDKLEKEGFSSMNLFNLENIKKDDYMAEVKTALEALGYKKAEIDNAVKEIKEIKDVEDGIRKALRILSKL